MTPATKPQVREVFTAIDRLTVVTRPGDPTVTLISRWAGDIPLGPADALRLAFALTRAAIRAALS